MMDEPQQLILDLPHEPSRRREDFIVTPANRAALTLVEAWPDWPAPGLLVIGPAGSGKSHLGQIWRERSHARLVPAAALDEALLADIAPASTLLVEDADRCLASERALFHLLNLTGETGLSLLITARTPPPRWGLGLPDLASRLTALPSIALEAPDDDLLAAVMAKQFSDRQVAVDPEILGYLVQRMERSLASASAIVDRLDRMALAEGRRITKALAARVVGQS